jgi:hypothetical protein
VRRKLFPFVIALSALSVSASAVFYSVFGLSKLFAGASTQVIIMATTLEVAKLVVASLLYQYWTTINKLLRIYLLISCFVLMIITSGGIYGFLSAAYQSTANKSEIAEKELVVIDMKRSRFNESREEYKKEKEIISLTIKDLRVSLSNPNQIQYIDRESGQLITTTSSSTRRALQKELTLSVEERNRLNLKLEAATDSITKLDIAVLNKESDNKAEQELGPLKYISELTDTPMNKIVNYLLLLIIFVFDPLAIAMVVAANFAFSETRPKFNPKEYTVYKEGDEIAAEIDLPPVDVVHSKEDSIDLGSDVIDSEERKAESVEATTPEVSNTNPDLKDNSSSTYGGGVIPNPVRKK